MAYLPILTYHRLLPVAPTRDADPKRISVSAAQFRSHLAWLKRLGYATVRLEDYARQLGARHDRPRRSIAITFDDGYEEVFTLALPLLREFGFTATVFGVPGHLGGTNAWDDGRAPLLSAEQYRALDRAGMTIGAHTMTHVHLPTVAAETAAREIADSKARLEDLLGKTVTLFAYPYGERDPASVRAVQAAGFEAAFATDRAPAAQERHPFEIRRAVVFPRNNAWEVLWKAQSWYPGYQDWKRARRPVPGFVTP